MNNSLKQYRYIVQKCILHSSKYMIILICNFLCGVIRYKHVGIHGKYDDTERQKLLKIISSCNLRKKHNMRDFLNFLRTRDLITFL